MGRIKIGEIKKATFTVLERYPDKFTDDFEENKKILNELNIVEEKKNRNKVAGYITTIVKRKKREHRTKRTHRE